MWLTSGWCEWKPLPVDVALGWTCQWWWHRQLPHDSIYHLHMFHECLPSCKGMPVLIDGTIQLVALPFDNIFLAIHSDWGNFGVPTLAVMVLSGGIFKCLLAVRTIQGHGKSRQDTRSNCVYKPLQLLWPGLSRSIAQPDMSWGWTA